MMGPKKIVTISECHNNGLFYIIKLPLWTSLWLTKNCRNKQFVTISVVTITEEDYIGSTIGRHIWKEAPEDNTNTEDPNCRDPA